MGRVADDPLGSALLSVQAARTRLVELMSRQGASPVEGTVAGGGARMERLRLVFAYLALRRAVARGARCADLAFGSEPDE